MLVLAGDRQNRKLVRRQGWSPSFITSENLPEPWEILNLDISLRMRSTSMWFAPSRNV